MSSEDDLSSSSLNSDIQFLRSSDIIIPNIKDCKTTRQNHSTRSSEFMKFESFILNFGNSQRTSPRDSEAGGRTSEVSNVLRKY